MCDLYSIDRPQAEIRQLAKVMEDLTGNLAPLPSIFPDQKAPVIINAPPNATRQMLMMRWGFPQPPARKGSKPNSGYLTNVRNTASPYWKPYLRPEFRCLVPVTSFCEPDWRSGTCVLTWFALDHSRPLFFFAGIWRGWNGVRGTKANLEEANHLVFSFLTTTPNAEVKQLRERVMPVLLLNEADRETWMNAPVEEALALQRPAPDGTLKIVARGSNQDGS